MAKQYKYYACCKDMSGNGVTGAGKDTVEEAYKDLEELKGHTTNGMIFIGVIKCAGNPIRAYLPLKYKGVECGKEQTKA